MGNTLFSPVISKIFLIRASATTTCNSPPSSRHRLSPPTSTPSAVESRKVTASMSSTTVDWPLGDHPVQRFAQLRRRGHVDLPHDRDHRDALVDPFFDAKLLLHGAQLSSVARIGNPSPGTPAMAIGQRDILPTGPNVNIWCFVLPFPG
jgi:hypothetical protein